MEDKAKKYYEYLKSKGIDVAPSFESFQNTLQDDNKRQKYYEYLQTKDVDVAPNFESFTNTLTVKKKEQEQPQEEVITEDSSTVAMPSYENGEDTLKDERLAGKPKFADLTDFQKKQKEIQDTRESIETPLSKEAKKKSISETIQAYDNEISNIESEINSIKEEYEQKERRLQDFVFKIPNTTQVDNLYEIDVNGQKQLVTGESVAEYTSRVDALENLIKEYQEKFKDLSKRYANLYVAKQRFQLEKDQETQQAVKEVINNLPFQQQIGMRLFGALKMGTEQILGSAGLGLATSEVGITQEEIDNASPEVRSALIEAREQVRKEQTDLYKSSVNKLEQSAETSLQYGLAKSLNDVNSPQDLVNYAVTAFGEQLPQFAQGALTLGYGTYIQELGSMQQEIVNDLMNNKGMTLDEALNSEEVKAIDQRISAMGIAALDLLGLATMGAGKLIKPLAKMNIAMKSIKAAPKAAIGTVTEMGTEILQEAVAKGGVSSALGEGFFKGMSELTVEEATEVAAKTFFGAAPMTSVSAFTEKQTIDQDMLNEASVNQRTKQVLDGIIRARENAGIISTEEADRQIAELNASIAANLQIPENIQGEKRAKLIALQTEYDEVLQSQKEASKPFKILYEGDLAKLEKKIAEVVNSKEDAEKPVPRQAQESQSIEQQKADIERRRQEELLGKSFTATTEKVVTGKGQSAGKTVVRFTESKISSDGEVLIIKPKAKFKNEDTPLTTIPETITVKEFREQFYENLSEQDKEMFDEFFTDDSTRIKLVEARIGLKGNTKGQVNIDVESLEGQPFGFKLQKGKEINDKYDAELAALGSQPTQQTSEVEAKKADIERRRQEELKSEKSFEGQRGQADLLKLPDNYLTKGEWTELRNVNISQDTTMPDYRSGRYKVVMISVNTDFKDGIVTFTNGNEVITPKISDLINAKYDAEITELQKQNISNLSEVNEAELQDREKTKIAEIANQPGDKQETAKTVTAEQKSKQEQKEESAEKKAEKAFNMKPNQETSNFIERAKKFWDGFVTRIVDRQNIVKNVLKKGGLINTYNRLVTSKGASGRAKAYFQEAEKKIYGGLSYKENKMLDYVIFLRRISAIDKNRSERGLPLNVKHPNGLTGEQADLALNKLEKENPSIFKKINERADAYFDEFRTQLKKSLDAGLITKEMYDNLVNIDYQPRQFLKFIIGDNGVDVRSLVKLANDYGLSKPIIKSLKDGDDTALNTDSRHILASAMNSAEKRIFQNEIGKTLARELPKSTERLKKLQSKKELTNKEKQELEDLKKVAESFKENPIIGYDKNGKPKYKFNSENAPKGYSTVFYYKDGVQNRILVKDNVYDQWVDNKRLFQNSDAGKIISIITGSALLKAMATGINPLFVVTNIPRDFGHILMHTNSFNSFLPVGGMQLLTKTAKAWREMSKGMNSELFRDFVEHGGMMDFLHTQGGLNENNILSDIVTLRKNPKLKKLLKDAASSLTVLNQYSEIGFRLALFDKVLSDGMKKIDSQNLNSQEKAQAIEDLKYSAAAQAREIIDFNQGGSWTKDAEPFMPYINAAVQGARVAAEYMKDNPQTYTLKAFQAAMFFSTGTTALSMALIAMLSDEEDKKVGEIWNETMETVSEYEKRTNVILPLGIKDEEGNYMYIRISKTQQVRPLFAVTDFVVENMSREIGGKDKYSNDVLTDRLTESIFNDFSPIDFRTPHDIATRSPLIGGVIETATGYSFFKEEKISYDIDKVPLSMEGYKSKNMPEIYNELSDKFGWSPARTKNLVEKFLTSPTTNPYTAILYSAADATVSDMKLVPSIKENALKNAKTAFGKFVKSGSDYNRGVYKNKEKEKVKEEIEIEEVKKNIRIKEIAKNMKGQENLSEEATKFIEQQPEQEQEKIAKKIYDYANRPKATHSKLDIVYARSIKVRAALFLIEYGKLDGDALDSALEEMSSYGMPISDSFIKEYEDLKSNR